jgi:hypothetical protein
MSSDGDKERRQWKAALATTEDCLTVEELSRHADGSLPDGAKTRASSHLDRCVRCQTELAMLKEFELATPRAEELAAVSWVAAELKRRSSEIGHAAPNPASSRSMPSLVSTVGLRNIFASRRVSSAALSLAAMLVAIAAGFYLTTAKEPILVSDGSTGQTVLRSQGVVALAPKGDLAQSPTELRWQPVAGADHYSVKLMEVDRVELWQGLSKEPSVTLPPAVREKIVPGKSLLWQVTALNVSGQAVATSQVERFRVAIAPETRH